MKRILLRIGLCISLLAAAAAGLVPGPAGGGEPRPGVRIGMVNTLFRDVPASLMLAMMKPFGSMMAQQTGVSGELVPGGEPMNLGTMLAEDKVQLAVMHGFEFAWVRSKHPQLQPLMIAVNQNPHLRAQLVVRDDADARGLICLKDKVLALPKGTREHCRLYLDRQCLSNRIEARQHFEKICTSSSVEDALDDVVDGTANAALVDGVAMDCFKRRKPARHAKLKVVQESEIFPAGVVVYNPANIDPATVERFKEGMLNSNKTTMGRQLLTMWKLTSFEPIPEDYESILDAVVIAYPPPAPKPDANNR